MTTLHATAYDITAPGFYFESEEEFNKKYDKHLPVEEYEIQYIDGDNPHLFDNANINQSNLSLWFDELSSIDDDSDEAIALEYLLSICGYNIKEALDQYEDVHVFDGSLSDYAYEFFNECHEIPEFLSSYIDYDRIANDMNLNSEIHEIKHNKVITNCCDF